MWFSKKNTKTATYSQNQKPNKKKLYMQRDIFNQIFHYTPCIMLKRVTSPRTHPCIIEPARNTDNYEEMSQWKRAIGKTVSDLTRGRFEPQTFLFRDIRITAGPERDLAI